MSEPIRNLLSALDKPQPDAAARQLGALAETAVTDLPTFQQSIDLLAYHGRDRLLADLIRIVWPLLQATRDPALLKLRNELVTRGTDSLIFAHLATQQYTSLPVEPPADLLAALQVYFPIDEAGLARYLAVLSGLEKRDWQMAAFDLSPDSATLPDAVADNLTTLLVEFVATAHNVEGMSFGKANLAAPELRVYFSMRRIGQLTPRDSIQNLMAGGGPRPFPTTSATDTHHPLVPDVVTFENYLSRLLHFANPLPYRAAAVYEAVPAWLRFLTERGLLDAETMQATLDEIGTLRSQLATFWQEQSPDPALQTGLDNWG